VSNGLASSAPLKSNSSTPNSTRLEVTFLLNRNLYNYSPLSLILSYGLALLFTIISVAAGLHAFHHNGVIHISSFSSIVATTRNPELDELSKGNSLGSLRHDERLRGTRLRFGALERGAGSGVEHVCFGREAKVVELKKGGMYG
jgi:hypothetical protein